MHNNIVIVRDCRGKPLRRVAVSRAGRSILVASERSLAVPDSESLPAIGCPDHDIFQFDPEKFDQLENEWNENGRVRDDLWNGLIRYSV